jgi:A/G-specific adenine glycosylase
LKSGSLRGISLKASPGNLLTRIEHTYSHFSITVHAFIYQAAAETRTDVRLWVPVERLSSYPMGKVDRIIAKRLGQLKHSQE